MFGCVHKCRAGTSGKSSNHGEELFISQEKVDTFLANYSKRPSSKSTVCEQKDFFSYFVCCYFTLTFCYPSVLIPLLNQCNERPKVTVMFIACNGDVSVVLFKYGAVWRVNYYGTGCWTHYPKLMKLKYIVNLLCKLNLQDLVSCQLEGQVHNLYCSSLFSLILFYYCFQIQFFLLFCNYWSMLFKGNIIIFAYTTNSAKGVYHHSCRSQAWIKEEGLLSSSRLIGLSNFKFLWEIDKYLLLSANVFLATFPTM